MRETAYTFEQGSDFAFPPHPGEASDVARKLNYAPPPDLLSVSPITTGWRHPWGITYTARERVWEWAEQGYRVVIREH